MLAAAARASEIETEGGAQSTATGHAVELSFVPDLLVQTAALVDWIYPAANDDEVSGNQLAQSTTKTCA